MLKVLNILRWYLFDFLSDFILVWLSMLSSALRTDVSIRTFSYTYTCLFFLIKLWILLLFLCIMVLMYIFGKFGLWEYLMRYVVNVLFLVAIFISSRYNWFFRVWYFIISYVLFFCLGVMYVWWLMNFLKGVILVLLVIIRIGIFGDRGNRNVGVGSISIMTFVRKGNVVKKLE